MWRWVMLGDGSPSSIAHSPKLTPGRVTKKQHHPLTHPGDTHLTTDRV